MNWRNLSKIACMFAVLLAWATMAGIDQAQPPWGETCVDTDGDGYGDPASPACAHPELDCDDANPDVNPGATEGPYGDATCSDGIDNDCNGEIDAQDPGCTPPCIDSDGDGYGNPASPLCAHPELDCEDCAEAWCATVYPGAPEICDGIDNQCLGDAGYA
jgi:hypothetical protein